MLASKKGFGASQEGLKRQHEDTDHGSIRPGIHLSHEGLSRGQQTSVPRYDAACPASLLLSWVIQARVGRGLLALRIMC